jgi:hypothetical protein
MSNFVTQKNLIMENKSEPIYSRSVVEFVAVANEFCKYAERAREVKGLELLKILQRILPLMYLKASLLPELSPVFEDGNEKFVTEADWNKIHDNLREQFGSADDYLEIADVKMKETEGPVVTSISENLADIYQDAKDFLLLYQTGTDEVMNDAVWECRLNFETIWGLKLLNALREIHKFVYSGEEPEAAEPENDEENEDRNTSDWFITKRQRDLQGDGE